MKLLFHRKARPARIEYDPSVRVPVLRCSICTGERVAGFKNLQTGKFEERQLITTDEELNDFMRACGVDTLEKIY